MLGLMFTLSAVESFLPPIGPLAAFRPGLSNIVIMYIIFFVGKKDAFLMAVLKSAFVFITRGYMAFMLSLGGGLLSVAVIVLAALLTKNKASLLILSVLGAVFHNLGQIFVISLILNSVYYFYYMPFFIVLAVVTGSVTGICLKYIIPALDALRIKE